MRLMIWLRVLTKICLNTLHGTLLDQIIRKRGCRKLINKHRRQLKLKITYSVYSVFFFPLVDLVLTYNTARIFCGAFSRFRTFTLLSFRRDLKVDTIAAYRLVRCGTSEGKLRETLTSPLLVQQRMSSEGGGGGAVYSLIWTRCGPKGYGF